MCNHYLVRPATHDDYSQINNLITYEWLVHEQLDWSSHFDISSGNEIILIENGRHILAALAYQERPTGTTWIRLFVTSGLIEINQAWELLLQYTNPTPIDAATRPKYSLSFNDLYTNLLIQSGFSKLIDIITLEYPVQKFGKKTNLTYPIHKIKPSDVGIIELLDRFSFSNPWQIGVENLKIALNECIYANYIKADNQAIGYQLITGDSDNAHIARLAVDVSYQRKGIGSTLLMDGLNFLSANRYSKVSVNTQSDNFASISLYKSFNFIDILSNVPVYYV